MKPSVSNFPLRKEDVVFLRNNRAKRYIMRIDADGRIRITVPRSGTQKGALEFANEHRDWIDEQINLACEAKQNLRSLYAGDTVLLRGLTEQVNVVKDWGRPVLEIGPYRHFIADAEMELTRPVVELLREIARKEIPSRLHKFAQSFRLIYERVVIRDQRTRWGSCSTSGVISLNWRLVMMPPEVMDYVIIHELMHLVEMNHSQRFWNRVAKACPRYKEHINWLDNQGLSLYP